MLVAREGFDAKSEGNLRNAYIESIGFTDSGGDGDRDTDILLFINGNLKVPKGSFLRGSGSVNMAYVKVGKNSNLKLIKEPAFRKK